MSKNTLSEASLPAAPAKKPRLPLKSLNLQVL
ncbi:Uncharacterised protein [Serratia rubidaea]|uniref:Uncharacterized protein n=2 Tax=Serratia rubidaea TaxID=61652 RepID=A0A4U9H7Y7_SERRU|nr:Uncharacterised protein [Serratia rubidaea]